MENVTTVCMVCNAVLVQGPPNTEVSHGIGPCCWASYRAKMGLKPRPFPYAYSAEKGWA